MLSYRGTAKDAFSDIFLHDPSALVRVPHCLIPHGVWLIPRCTFKLFHSGVSAQAARLPGIGLDLPHRFSVTSSGQAGLALSSCTCFSEAQKQSINRDNTITHRGHEHRLWR